MKLSSPFKDLASYYKTSGGGAGGGGGGEGREGGKGNSGFDRTEEPYSQSKHFDCKISDLR